MSATLYLLRQQAEQVSPSLFVATDPEKEVVFLEHLGSGTSFPLEGVFRKSEKALVRDSSQQLTYDDLVEKIFSSTHVIVI